MEVSEIANDPLVKETLRIMKEEIAQQYKDRDYGAPPMIDQYLEPDTDHDPVYKVLAEAGCLDSVTAAALVADRGRSWVDDTTLLPKLDKDVAAAVRALRDADNMMDEGPAGVLDIKNPTARNMIFASMMAMFSGDEFEEMKAEARDAEVQMMIGQASAFIGDIGERMIETKAWEYLPPKLVDKYVEGMQNLVDLTTSKTAKRVIKSVLDELKTEIARANAAEVTEPSQPAQIDPNSPFAQLKDTAKKFKLQ